MGMRHQQIAGIQYLITKIEDIQIKEPILISIFACLLIATKALFDMLQQVQKSFRIKIRFQNTRSIEETVFAFHPHGV